jgi:hypothetical protein
VQASAAALGRSWNQKASGALIAQTIQPVQQQQLTSHVTTRSALFPSSRQVSTQTNNSSSSSSSQLTDGFGSECS